MYDHAVLSIEHVLPQSPLEGSEWCKSFPTHEVRESWVHRLGNLLLLNHRKNSSASNYDFAKKKSVYFSQGGVSPFPLTTQVICESEWTPQVVRRRQRALLESLMKAWRLTAEFPVESPDDLDEADVDGNDAVNFHQEIIPVLESHFGVTFVRQSRALWASPDNSVLLSCQASKKYDRKSQDYWFGLKRTTKSTLEAHPNSYCAFGLGRPEKLVLVPYSVIKRNISHLNTTPHKDGGVFHWHVSFCETGEKVELMLSPKAENVDVTEFLLEKQQK